MGGTYIKAIVAVIIAATVFSSCKKDCDCAPPPVETGGQKVFIVCEGSFGNGNSSLSLYLPEKDSVYEDIYKQVNGNPLGDVFQSMLKIKDRYYLCINNSDKIIALNDDLSFSALASVLKPRYILPVSSGKAYVSSLFNNKLYVFDPAGVTVQGSIDLPAMNAEGMLLRQDKVYVCPWDTAVNRVYVINTTTDEVMDSLAIAGYAPQDILVDKEDKLWVLSGNVTKGKPAFWTRIDPVSRQTLRVYSFPPDADVIKPVMNAAKDSIYFIEVNYKGGTQNNGIYRMSIHAQDLPHEAFIAAQQNQYFWALGISPFSGDIYIGDPKGFSQRSTVRVYTPDGSLKKQFNTGAGAGHFYFTE